MSIRGRTLDRHRCGPTLGMGLLAHGVCTHSVSQNEARMFPVWLCAYVHIAAAAKSLPSCPTLWDPIDGSPPGSPIPGILQSRTLEWVAISFSNAWKWKVKVKSLSRVRLFTTPWNAAHQAPPSMGFSRQEYWNGVPLPSPYVPIRDAQKHSLIHTQHFILSDFLIFLS